MERHSGKTHEDSKREKQADGLRFYRWLQPRAADEDNALAQWRETILFTVLATALLLSFAAFIPAIVVGLREGLWGLIFIDSAVYLGTWYLFLFRGLNYKFRAIAATLLVYGVGLNVCLQVGMLSGGPAYLFTSAILAGLLIGLDGAIAAVLLNTITMAALGYIFAFGHLAGENAFFTSIYRAMAAGASFILLNAVSAISVAMMVRGLHRTTAKQEELTGALRRSEAKYRLLTENIRDVIFTLDMEMDYTYVSPAVKHLQGWQPDELIGSNVADTLPEKSLELAAETLQAELALAEATQNYQRSVALELELLHKNGSTVWGEVTAVFIMSEDGMPAGILGVTRDISERLKSQQEREDLQEQLVRSKKMEALGLLAGGVAHDLNNVLSGIISYPDLILLDMDESDPMQRPLQAIRTSGYKAAAIVQDLLTLARRGVVTTTVLNLNTLIREYLRSPEHQEMMSLNFSVEVNADLEPHLPNISGSSVHLKKALMNLVSNAVEAQPGGGVITITTRSRYLDLPVSGYDHVEAGEYVILTVADQGEGISKTDLPRIFEPFYTKKVMGRSGTGLGMAVVWGAIQDHKGYIDVQSVLGEGTCFTLYFPMTRQELRDQDTPVPVASYRGRGETILVVDDIEEQRVIAKVLLERLNYTVATASSGEKAIAYVRENPVDLLLLDMIMQPGIDGLDTYRSILVHRPGQKAVIASGYAETSRVKEAVSLGAGPYVKKPYSIEKIGLAVRKALQAETSKPSDIV